MKPLKLLFTAFTIITICNSSQAQTTKSRIIGATYLNYNTSGGYTPIDSDIYIYSSGHGGYLSSKPLAHSLYPSMRYIGSYDTFYQKKFDIITGSYKDMFEFWQTFDSKGNLLTYNSKEYNNLTSSMTNFEQVSYTYDANNNLLKAIVQEWDNVSSSWHNTFKNTYTYDANNNQLSDTVFSSNGSGGWDYTDLNTYSYDAHNNLIGYIFYRWDNSSRIWEGTSKGTYKLNTNNAPDSIIDYTWNRSSHSWDSIKILVFLYDAHNNNTADTIFINASGALMYNMTHQYTYNTSNDCTEEEISSYFGGTGWIPIRKFIYTVDAHHNRTNTIEQQWNNTSNIFIDTLQSSVTYNSYDQLKTFATSTWDKTSSSWTHTSTSELDRFYYETYLGVNNIPHTAGSIQLYPSPATDVVHVHLKWNSTQKATICVYDATGRLWNQRQTDTTKEYNGIIPVANYPAGNYIITITGKTGQLSKVFSVVH